MQTPSSTQPTSDTYTFWGGALSLFSGKVRSYLIKKGVPYREFYSVHPEFNARVYPIVRLRVTPIVETPQGEVLQDSTAIILALEQSLPARPMVPATPLQRVLAHLLDAYATEHLLLPAMHYRWAEPHVSEQRRFLDAEFGRVSYLGNDRAARNAAGARMMGYFSNMLGGLGGTPETAPAIEAVYLDLLERLDEHFQHHPYLLGGHPSLADFGFMAPLYAHLGRDPVPARLMALRAPNVKRWVERMNLAVIPDGEFPDQAPAFLPDDALPPTLEPVLQMLFQDWTPELLANVQAYHDWLAAEPQRPEGTLLSVDGKRRVHPSLGPIHYPLRGVTVQRASAPQTLWHFDLVQQCVRSLDGAAKQRWDALMERVGGQVAMGIRLQRPIVRKDYVLTLGGEAGR